MSNGAVLQNSITATKGGGVYLYSGTFNMSGGTISENHATSGGGVEVWIGGGTFNMNGGTISGNDADYGGGVEMNSGTVTMSGDSTISGNTAKVDGGGVYVYSSTFTMSDSSAITGNNAINNGSGVYLYSGTFNMNGSAKVNADNDVYLYSGRFITVTGDLNTDAGAKNITSASIVNGTSLVTYGSFSIPDIWTNTFVLNTSWASINVLTLTNTSDQLLLVTNCTVRFYNETEVVYAVQYAPSGSKITEPSPAPTKTGYTLSGWNNTTSGADTPWNFITDIVTVNPTNLSANWTANTYNITYLNNGGSGTIANQSVIFNTTVILNDGSNLSRTGYTLANWTTASDGSGTSYALGGTISPYLVADNLTLYAIWTATPVPTDSGEGGDDGNNADYGPVSPNGTFTTEDGNLTLYYPAGSNIMVTVFPNYLGGAAAPLNVSYLNVYDVHSTANSGTSVTLVINIAASELERMNLTSNDITILHYYDGEWHQMTITSIELVDGVYQFTVTSTHTSPFMIAYNVDRSSFPIEDTATPTTTPTSTPTTNPTETVPTSTTTPTPTEPTSSPVPLVGIIAGLGAAGLLLRRK